MQRTVEGILYRQESEMKIETVAWCQRNPSDIYSDVGKYYQHATLWLIVRVYRD